MLPYSRLTPIGVASLIGKAIGSAVNLEETFKGLGLFVLDEVIGDIFLGLILLPSLPDRPEEEPSYLHRGRFQSLDRYHGFS
jgi:hypothetical protein